MPRHRRLSTPNNSRLERPDFGQNPSRCYAPSVDGNVTARIASRRALERD
jgi:phage baseplate assembly protein W